jgi:hypothetical protein
VGQVTSLRDIVTSLRPRQRPYKDEDTLATIYASEPWTPESRAIIIVNGDDSTDPPAEAKALGLTYFLEVFIAQDFLEGWAKNHGGNVPEDEICPRLIEYAINDA